MNFCGVIVSLVERDDFKNVCFYFNRVCCLFFDCIIFFLKFHLVNVWYLCQKMLYKWHKYVQHLFHNQMRFVQRVCYNVTTVLGLGRSLSVQTNVAFVLLKVLSNVFQSKAIWPPWWGEVSESTPRILCLIFPFWCVRMKVRPARRVPVDLQEVAEWRETRVFLELLASQVSLGRKEISEAQDSQ